MVVPSSSSSSRDQVLKLIEQKDKIDITIKDLGCILETNNVGMDESLVDESGFPRNDIDIYQVRHARHEIICLKNDLKALLKEIEKGLETVHAEKLQNNNVSTTKLPPHGELLVDNRLIHTKAIAKVNLVNTGSPAEDAGIQVRDEIVEFGTINASNFKDLSQVASLVRSCENKNLPVKVKRNGHYIDITLVPKSWPGRGLLGCNIMPIENF